MNRLKKFAYAIIPAVPPVQGRPIDLSEIQGRIQQIAQFLIVISMVVAVIFIVYGAIRYMVTQDSASAKSIIFSGVIGAAVVLGVGVILQTTAGLVTRTFFN